MAQRNNSPPVDDTWFREVADHLEEGVYFVAPDRQITYWNAGAGAISGYQAEDVVGHHCFANRLRHVDDAGTELCLHGCPLLATIQDGQPRRAEVYLHHREGHRVPVDVRTVPVRNGAGEVIGAIEVFTDRSERVEALARIRTLERDALVDPLTGTPNRRFMERELQSRLGQLQRYGWPFGVLFIDIDDFKTFNDQHGHETGDTVLRMVALSLTGGLRGHDVVGRWGGEEFVAVVTHVESPAELEVVGNRLRLLVLRSGLTEPGRTLRVTVSLGGVLARPNDDVPGLVARADEQMYASKRAGRNCLTIG